MKDKILGVFAKVAEHKKVVLPIIVAVVVIIVIAIAASILGGGPSKYKTKIKDFTDALSSKSKMKSAFDKTFDVRAAVAWQEADGEAENFKEEYKNIKKDDAEIEDFKDNLKDFADNCSELDFKVSKIKEPKKDSNNKNIYTVSATLSARGEETQVKFVFYKNKIIDIIYKDSKKSLIKAYRELWIY